MLATSDLHSAPPHRPVASGPSTFPRIGGPLSWSPWSTSLTHRVVRRAAARSGEDIGGDLRVRRHLTRHIGLSQHVLPPSLGCSQANAVLPSIRALQPRALRGWHKGRHGTVAGVPVRLDDNSRAQMAWQKEVQRQGALTWRRLRDSSHLGLTMGSRRVHRRLEPEPRSPPAGTSHTCPTGPARSPKTNTPTRSSNRRYGKQAGICSLRATPSVTSQTSSRTLAWIWPASSAASRCSYSTQEQ